MAMAGRVEVPDRSLSYSLCLGLLIALCRWNCRDYILPKPMSKSFCGAFFKKQPLPLYWSFAIG